MPLPRFTPETEKVLRAAGWFEGRTVAPELMDSWLVINWNPEGYSPNGYSTLTRAAWRILNEFGGLSIKPPNLSHWSSPFTFEPRLVPDNTDFSHQWDFELFPFGEVFSTDPGATRIVIAVDNAGRIFLLCLNTWLMGNTIEEALEKMISDEVGEMIETDYSQGFESLQHSIYLRVLERDFRLLGGQWPTQPPLKPIKNAAYNAITDWKAEGDRVARAFGIAQPCHFHGPDNWKVLHRVDAGKTHIDDWYNSAPSLCENVELQVSYYPHSRNFYISNRLSLEGTSVSLTWEGQVVQPYPQPSEYALPMAKGLYRLGLLTPYIERALKLSVSNHDKMEWQLETITQS